MAVAASMYGGCMAMIAALCCSVGPLGYNYRYCAAAPKVFLALRHSRGHKPSHFWWEVGKTCHTPTPQGPGAAGYTTHFNAVENFLHSSVNDRHVPSPHTQKQKCQLVQDLFQLRFERKIHTNYNYNCKLIPPCFL